MERKVFIGPLIFTFVVGSTACGLSKAEPGFLRHLRGGVLIQVGLEDQELFFSLAGRRRILVQGLDTSRERVLSLRNRIHSKGLSGPLSAAVFDGKNLPYAESSLNAILVLDPFKITHSEFLRALVPGGILARYEKGKWKVTKKEWPCEIDEWTHFLHDPSGNPVSQDTRVGPPRFIQWAQGPDHARSHEHTPSVNCVVSSAGRIFYLVDTGPIASIRCPASWALVCRDAFNGSLLWSRTIKLWFPHIVNWGAFPIHLQRRLVAVGEQVFVTLGYFAPVSKLDARTGTTLKTYQNTEGTEEILYHRGILILSIRRPTKERRSQVSSWIRLQLQEGSPLFARETAQPFLNKFRATERSAPCAVRAVDSETGKLLWTKEGKDAAGLRPLSLCVDGKRVFYYRRGETVCVDLLSGKTLWSRKSPPVFFAKEGKVFCAGRSKIACLDGKTGSTIWSCESWLVQIRDLFLIGDYLYVGGFRPYQGKRRARRGPAWGPYFVVQREKETGKFVTRIAQKNPGHHHRCYRNKATLSYVLSGRRGVEFIDLKRKEVLWHNWVRGVCRYGIMPANGFLYAPPHACGCYITCKLDGFYALSSRKKAPSLPQGPVLRKGPAFGKLSFPKQESGEKTNQKKTQQGGWPTYRCDPQRSGSTTEPVEQGLRILWCRSLGGSLTPPTAKGGLVFVALPEKNALYALDALTGSVCWSFVAGSRIDSPPTCWQNLLLFGSRDGVVHCLRARDGQEVWTLRAEGSERFINFKGTLESVRPVCGSILVWDEVAYVLAGRSSYLDGGLVLYGVQPKTGKILFKRTIYSPDPKTGRQPPQYGPDSMPGVLEDILVAGNKYFYLKTMAFDKKGEEKSDPEPHLLALTGFLDSSWPHRSYWIFGTEASISIGCAGRKRGLVYGRLLCVTESSVIGYGRRTVHWSNQLLDGYYRIFAFSKARKETLWEKRLPFPVRGLIVAGSRVYASGPASGISCGNERPFSKGNGALLVIDGKEGRVLEKVDLPSSCVFDGLAASAGKLFISLESGELVCLGKEKK